MALSTSSGSGDYGLFDELAEEFADRYRRGERPSLKEYIDRCPEMGDEIRELFPALVEVEQAEEVLDGSAGRTASPPTPALRQVGDYRVIREVGRGGMGVVYEAEQISLGRRVALKILPGGVAKDRKALERFRREARAAARLHHTNIVPVFEVGQDGEIVFYAMQFIQGQGLDEVIHELARQRDKSERQSAPPKAAGAAEKQDGPISTTLPARTGSVARSLASVPVRERTETLVAVLRARQVSRVARALVTGTFAAASMETDRTGAGGGVLATETPDSRTTSDSGWSATGSDSSNSSATSRSTTSAVLPGGTQLSAVESSGRRLPFFRSVAQIGRQTAQGLAYAHARGVIHRDIKPSNLLLDTAGVVWITDFGLAKADDEGLTATGDILGTIRYMAPERFRGEGDARADVYALGLTLYELLTLRPGFPSSDRLQIIERIKTEEPVRPRTVDGRIPRDLETIVLKAIDKDPHRRYPTADAMAEDLRRFIDDEPIQARRTGLAERAWRWSRRNPVVASLAGALFVALVAGTAIASYYAVRAREGEQRALDNAHQADDRAESLRRQDYVGRVNLAYRECLDGNVARALELLAGCPGDLRDWEWFYAKRQCHLDLHTFIEPGGQMVNGVAFSPDSLRIASVSGPLDFDRPSLTGDLVVRDVANGQVVFADRDVPSGFRAVAFSPDSRWVATANGSALVIRDASTGKKRLQLTDPGNLPLLSLAYSPDGRRIIAGYGSVNEPDTVGDARLWDAVNGTQVGDTIRGHPGGIFSVAFSPNDREVALASKGLVEEWDLETRELVQSLRGHDGLVYVVAYSPDGRYLASGGLDATVRLWERTTGREIRAFYGHEGAVRSLAFSPKGRGIISAGADNLLKLWDVASGRPLAAFHGHERDANCIAFSSDGRYLASGSADHTVKLWLASSSLQLIFTGHDGWVFGLAFSPDSLLIASGGSYNSTRDHLLIWNATTGVPAVTFGEESPQVTAVSFRRDGRRLATACRDGIVRIWDTKTGELVWLSPPQANEVSAVAYSPDGSYLASAATNLFNPPAYSKEPGEVKLWDADTGREIRTLEGHTAGVFDVAFSPDGRYLASACADKIVRIWDTTDLSREARLLRGHSLHVRRVCFLPDGRRVATAGGVGLMSGGEVKIWDLVSGARLHDLHGHTARVRGLACSPDGRRLATASDDRTVKLWDTATGQEVFTLRGHTGNVLSVVFSPDGQRIVSGDMHGTVRVWDTRRPSADALLRREAETPVKVLELPTDPFAP